jgi:hypothetical protein
MNALFFEIPHLFVTSHTPFNPIDFINLLVAYMHTFITSEWHICCFIYADRKGRLFQYNA